MHYYRQHRSKFLKRVSEFCLLMIPVFAVALILVAIMAFGEITPGRLAWIKPMTITSLLGLVASIMLHIMA